MNATPDDSTISSPQRLWTPWRMSYVGGSREAGCVFCNRASSNADTTSLIVRRANHHFVILNLFPYNTGHIMLVPNEHVQDPAELSSDALEEMGRLLPQLTTVLQFVQRCDGLNVGMNLGSAAGAGIAEHLHQHVVPRWNGDANFMPIVGGVKVLPEEIPATYAKVRAEFSRLEAGHERAVAVVLDPSLKRVHLLDDNLPTFSLVQNEPVWKSLGAALMDSFAHLDPWRWAGSDSVNADREDVPVMAFIGRPKDSVNTRICAIEVRDASHLLNPDFGRYLIDLLNAKHVS